MQTNKGSKFPFYLLGLALLVSVLAFRLLIHHERAMAVWSSTPLPMTPEVMQNTEACRNIWYAGFLASTLYWSQHPFTGPQQAKHIQATMSNLWSEWRDAKDNQTYLMRIDMATGTATNGTPAK